MFVRSSVLLRKVLRNGALKFYERVKSILGIRTIHAT